MFDHDYEVITRAIEFATNAHGDQKYGDRPYLYHLVRVSEVIRTAGYDWNVNMVVAGWLHDVIEDCGVSVKEIEREFGSSVADIVYRVTNEPGMNRRERWAATYPKIRGHDRATIIKLADRIANVEEGGELVTMYRKEYPTFRESLYLPYMGVKLWKHLDYLMEYE